MNIHKFKEGKGKAFSYFSIVGKNYLILHNNNNYKKMKIHRDIDVLDFSRNLSSEESVEESKESYNEFVEQMVEFWDNNIRNVFRRQKDILVADSVIELFRKRVNVENFNKKALYILIREMTGSNTQHITRVINVMKKYYKEMLFDYNNVGQIDTTNTGSIFNA
jgi:prophage tail gpP-like protein